MPFLLVVLLQAFEPCGDQVRLDGAASDYADLIESLVLPSKVISDQYRASVITSLGKVITGRIATEQDGKVTVLVDPEDATKVVVVDKDDIDDMQPSKTSLMPADLLNTLSQTELLDLIAYMMSRGNPNDVVFEK